MHRVRSESSAVNAVQRCGPCLIGLSPAGIQYSRPALDIFFNCLSSKIEAIFRDINGIIAKGLDDCMEVGCDIGM